MKFFSYILIVFFFMIPTYADIYYCIEDSKTGFDTQQNFKIERFQTKKFSAKIDLINKDLVSNDIYFSKNKKNKSCNLDRIENTLYCMNSFGQAFSFNTETYRFFLASVFNKNGLKDDATISYGKCEKF